MKTAQRNVYTCLIPEIYMDILTSFTHLSYIEKQNNMAFLNLSCHFMYLESTHTMGLPTQEK